ncbi:pentatricopeptide repeat-containing protein At2g21090-like [Primulina tabacum]|uniref:pentatricopeptide repeat-containing protein At2g21090-like n=1 Tax=Primulina tabacum TaxID=48773 RepID=UPI003F5A0AFE
MGTRPAIYTSTYIINHKINEHVRNRKVNDARKLFDQYSHWTNTVSWNSLISGYIQVRRVTEAAHLFDEMPQRDIVSWNTMLTGFRDSRNPWNAYRYFLQMIRQRNTPNELTLAVLFSAFLGTEFDILIPQLHCLVICFGLNLNVYLGSALMRGYIGLGDLDGFARVFDEILLKDVAPWNVLILGYMEFGMTNAARCAFDSMPSKNAYSWSILINGYMKNKQFDEAKAMFESQRDKDVVSWTTMVRGCVQSKKFSDALDFFYLMMKSGVRPNHFTFSCTLDACAGCSSLVLGNQVHACILKFGIPLDVVLSTSLVDMYGKCGDVRAAFCVFRSMSIKNLVSWNSIIGGCARHGLAEMALVEFEEMLKSGVTPDEITFVNVLSACVHGGLVKEGEELFNSMGAVYGMEAEMEHYACMVDLYGRAGELEKAEKLIKGMPFEPDVIVWGALLGACGLHSCAELGEAAADRIFELEQDHPAVYSMLSKIRQENGIYGGVISEKKIMQKWRARKQKAGSWI